MRSAARCSPGGPWPIRPTPRAWPASSCGGAATPAAPVKTVSDEQLAKEVGTARTEQTIKWTPADRKEAQMRLKALGFDPGNQLAKEGVARTGRG